jgi:hypothetical protein
MYGKRFRFMQNSVEGNDKVVVVLELQAMNEQGECGGEVARNASHSDPREVTSQDAGWHAGSDRTLLT